MDFHAALALGVPIGLGLTALGVGAGLGNAVASALQALGRQPDAMGKILLVMLTGCALIEVIVFYVIFLGPSLVKF